MKGPTSMQSLALASVRQAMTLTRVGIAEEPLLLQEYVHGNCGGCMNNLFYNDWFIIDNIAIKDVANMVKKGIKTTLPISLRSRSTTGGKAKQYDLFKYFKNNSALNNLKERITYYAII